MDNELSIMMQQNLLTLLAYDDNAGAFIAKSVDLGSFTNIYNRRVASICFDHFEQFKEAPKEHLPDELEEELQNEENGDNFRKLLFNIREHKEKLNPDYVLSRLNKFIRLHNLESGIMEAAKSLKAGDLTSAEDILNKAQENNFRLFDPGSRFDVKTVLESIRKTREDKFRMKWRIPDLDFVRAGPGPGELMVFVASTGKGKSWAMVHLAKIASAYQKTVVIITLEMSESKYLLRLIQSFKKLSRRQSELYFTKINKGRDSDIVLERVKREGVLSLGDPSSEVKVRDYMMQFESEKGKRHNIIIKQFPTNSISVKDIEVYLDSLERFEGIVPDLLIVDYADLMYLDPKNIRIDTGNVYKGFMRISKERNLAVVTPSQTNRSGESTRIITLKHLAEDYSKAHTADIVVTYNQTNEEYSLGLARLFLAKNRDEESKRLVVVTQSYPIGQFAMDSTMIPQSIYESQLGGLLTDDYGSGEED